MGTGWRSRWGYGHGVKTQMLEPCPMTLAEANAFVAAHHRLVTYTLDTENGASLKAAGWKCLGQAGGPRWTGKRRPAVDLYPAQMKLKWMKDADD